MPVVHIRIGGRVNGGTPPGPSWDGTGYPLGYNPTITGPQAIQGLFPYSGQVGRVPNGGMHGVGNGMC